MGNLKKGLLLLFLSLNLALYANEEINPDYLIEATEEIENYESEEVTGEVIEEEKEKEVITGKSIFYTNGDLIRIDINKGKNDEDRREDRKTEQTTDQSQNKEENSDIKNEDSGNNAKQEEEAGKR